jgi:two-component system cell cycle response regulator
MIDLDHFKRFNDTFGHPLGDKLLQELAALVSSETRQEVDVVARCGGDEFVVVMPLTAAGDEDAGAALAAERIRAAVGVHLFEGYPGRRDEHVTVSIGVASIADAADPAAPVGTDALSDDASIAARAAAVLLTAADKALYLAKRQGRDRVCLYEG